MWGNDKVVPIGENKNVKTVVLISQMKLFRACDYKNTEAWEKDVNNYIYKLSKKNKPHQVTSMQGEIHIMYGSDLS